MKRFTKIASFIMAIAIVASTLIIFPVTNSHVHAETTLPSAGVIKYSLSGNDFGKETSPYSLMWAPTVGSVYGYTTANIKAAVYDADSQTYTTNETTPRTMFSKHTDGRLLVHAIGDNAGDDKSAYKSPTVKFTAPVTGSYTFTWNVQRIDGNCGSTINIHLGSWSFDDSTKVVASQSDTSLYTKTKEVNLSAGQVLYFYMATTASNNTEVRTAFDVTATLNLAENSAFGLTQNNITTNPHYTYFHTTGAEDAPAWASKTQLVNATSSDMYGHANDSGVGINASKVVIMKCNGSSLRIDTPAGANNHVLISFKAPVCGTYTASFKTNGAGWNGEYVKLNYWVGNDTDGYVRKTATAYAIGTAGTYTLDVQAGKNDSIIYDVYSSIDVPLNNVEIVTTYKTETHDYTDATCLTVATCNDCGKTTGTVDSTNHESTTTYYYDLGTTHGKKFECCDGVDTSFTPEAHRGGTATCLVQATCEVCETKYGSFAGHTIKYEQTATQHTEYCDFDGCDHEEAPATHTWNNGACGVCNYTCQHPTWDADGCTVCGTDCAHEGGTATCTSPKICDKCGQPYGAKDMAKHTDTDVIYEQNGADGHIAKHDCCKEVISEDTAHAWEDGVCSKCEYECLHPSSTTADCQNESVCTVCGLKQGDKNMTKHKSDELTWTKTDDKHSAVHACCGTEAVAEADHTLVEGTCSVCNKTVENAVGTKYKLDITDLGSTTDTFEFFVTKNIDLSALTKLDRVFTGAGAGWAGAGTGIVAKGETVNSHFWKRDAEGQAGQMVAHIENGTYRIIAFKAPVNGEYTYNVSGHNWGKDNNGKIYIKSYRSGEANPVEVHYPQGDVRSDFTGKVELGKGEYLYLVFSGDIAENFMNVYDVSVTLDKKLSKAPDKIVDLAHRIGDLSGFPVKNFSFYVVNGLKTSNPSSEAMGKIKNAVPFAKVVEVKYGDWKGHYLDVEGGTINGFTAGYNDIQFMQSSESDLGLLIGPSKGEVLIIKYTVPADGKYSYSLSARDITASSNCAVMDVNVNGSSWWDMMKITGASHGEYKANQSSSQKDLKKGDEIYFIFRVTYGEGTVINVSDFAVVQHGVRVPATGDNTATYAISAIALICGAAVVLAAKKRKIEK